MEQGSRERLRMAMAALGEPHRFWLARCLAERPRSVGEMVRLSGWPQPLVSHHLACLGRAEVIEARRDGRRRVYRLDATGDPDLEALVDIVRRNRPLPGKEPAVPEPPGPSPRSPDSPDPESEVETRRPPQDLEDYLL